MEDCPVEIIENVVSLLSFIDICNLRLTCRSISMKTTGPYFLKFFRDKRVDITVNALRTFAAESRAQGLRSLLQNLTLVGVVIDDGFQYIGRPPQDNSLELKVRLLAEALQAIAKNVGRLVSLSVAVEVEKLGEHRIPAAEIHVHCSHILEDVRQRTKDACYAVLRSISKSQIPIESLSLFNAPGSSHSRLDSDVLESVDWSEPGFTTAFASLRKVSLRLHSRLVDRFEPHDSCRVDSIGNRILPSGIIQSPPFSHPRPHIEVVADEEDGRNFSGIASLLGTIYALESLEVDYCRRFGLSCHYKHKRLLQRVTEVETLPHIQRCTLKGLIVDEAHLLTFLHRTSPRELSLESVHMRRGSFSSIFGYCTGKAANMNKLYFDNLSQGVGYNIAWLWFLGPGSSRFNWDPFTDGTEMLGREGDEVRLPIAFHFPNIRRRTQQFPVAIGRGGDPNYIRWRDAVEREYGSPPFW